MAISVEPSWAEATWAGREQARRERWAALTAWERLQIMDDVDAFVTLLRAVPPPPAP